jgi:immunity protein, SdpI family
MPGRSLVRGVTVILAAYAAGAAWFWLDAARGRVTASTPLPSRVLIAFLLPTTAAVVLWLFHAIELHRPVCAREPADCASTERILFRVIVFIGALHGLVVLQLTDAVWIKTWAPILVFVLVGTLLVSVGNLLPTTRPNMLVGIRTPRSLRSRPFWMAINRVGGYVTMAVGLVMIVAAVLLRYPLSGQVTFAAAVAAAGILVARYRRLVRDFERS